MAMKVDFELAFEIRDADTDIVANVIFVDGDFSNPVDVRITDRRREQAVTIPFDLFQRFVEGVQKAAQQ